ncbi:MAG: hypothetical protein IJ682_09455 [Lachnospiraceae bacterium]|nr:hypothetical protein [Lachnospiraceae bacterium]
MADKAAGYTTLKRIAREELGDSAKYVTITTKDKSGKKIKPKAELNNHRLKPVG